MRTTTTAALAASLLFPLFAAGCGSTNAQVLESPSEDTGNETGGSGGASGAGSGGVPEGNAGNGAQASAGAQGGGATAGSAGTAPATGGSAGAPTGCQGTAAVLLADFNGEADGIPQLGFAVDSVEVFFPDRTGMRAVPRNGGAPREIQIDGVSCVQNVALAGDKFVLDVACDAPGVYVAPKSGGAAMQLTSSYSGRPTTVFGELAIVKSTNGIDLVSLDGSGSTHVAVPNVMISATTSFDAIYVTTQDGGPGDSGGSILRVPADGGQQTKLVTLTSPSFEIAVDAQGIVWAEQGDPASGIAPSFRSASLDGTSSITIDGAQIFDIATDGDDLLYSTGDNVVLRSRTTSVERVVASSQQAAEVVIDGDGIFWRNETNGTMTQPYTQIFVACR